MVINGKAPVCPISRSQAVPGMPGRITPNVPRAVDLPSAIQAVNTITNIIMSMYGPGMVINNVYPAAPMPGPATSGPNQDGGDGGGISQFRSRWVEKERKTRKKRYYGTDKDTGKRVRDIWVEVERITYIKWEDEKNDLELELTFQETEEPPE